MNRMKIKAVLLSVGAVVALAASGGILGVFSSTDSDTAFAAKKVPTWNASTRVIYNTPGKAGGSKAQQYAYIDEIKRALAAAVPGSTARIASYSLHNKSVVNALIAAKKRGVNVQFFTSREVKNGKLKAESAELKALKKGLGTNLKKPSFVQVCRGSCLHSGNHGTQHAKLMTIYVQRTAKARAWVTFVTSSNITDDGAKLSWNSTQVIVGETKLVEGINKYMNAMRYEGKSSDYPASVKSGIYTMYFYPKYNKAPLIDDLSKVACKYTVKQGKKKITRTSTVLVDMFQWSSDPAANRVVKLHQAGCKVEAIVDFRHIDPAVLKKLKKAKVPLANAGQKKLYLHAKAAMITGKVGGKEVWLTYGGSANLGASSWKNGNVTLTMTSKPYADAHAAWHNRVWKKSAVVIPRS